MSEDEKAPVRHVWCQQTLRWVPVSQGGVVHRGSVAAWTFAPPNQPTKPAAEPGEVVAVLSSAQYELLLATCQHWLVYTQEERCAHDGPCHPCAEDCRAGGPLLALEALRAARLSVVRFHTAAPREAPTLKTERCALDEGGSGA